VKLFVLLLVVASVAMFVLVLGTPGRLFPSATFWQDESMQTSEKADAKLTASLAAKSARIANFSTHREAPTARGTSPDTAAKAEIRVPTKAPVRTHPVKSDVFSSKVLTISGDSASLYAINSSKSNVLTVLSKGTIVEPNFQLIDAAENLMLVQVPTLNIIGFVEARNLATPSQETIPPITAVYGNRERNLNSPATRDRKF